MLSSRAPALKRAPSAEDPGSPNSQPPPLKQRDQQQNHPQPDPPTPPEPPGSARQPPGFPSPPRTRSGARMKRIIAALCNSSSGASVAYDPSAMARAPASARAGLDSAQRMICDKLTEDDGKVIEYEYQRQRTTNPAGACQAAEAPSNEARNRYSDVLPYDASRVRLQGQGSDYINASLLSSREGEAPPWQFIATQGPLDTTIEHLWQMAWEQQCPSMVMLTRCVEHRVAKCVPYFPESAGVSCTFGRFTITTASVSDIDQDVRARELVVTSQEEPASPRRLRHYHYHAWPDHGIPEATHSLRRLAHLLDATAPRGAGPELSGPPLIHCSAGIGRSGVLCTVAIALKRLRVVDPRDGAAARQAVNVKRIVAALRKQRGRMVQTYEQYLFCYQAIKEELDEMLGTVPVGPHSALSRHPPARS